VTAPSGYGTESGSDEHFFLFSESPVLASWLMRMSDFAERRSTKTLAQVLTKAALVFLEETDGAAADSAPPSKSKQKQKSSSSGGGASQQQQQQQHQQQQQQSSSKNAVVSHDDDIDAVDEFAADDADADFSLQSANFQQSLELLALQKRWAAKEAELRRIAPIATKAASGRTTVATIFSSSASSAVLTNDLLLIMKDEQSLGFSAVPVDDNIYHWRVKVFNFDPSSRLARDLIELKDKVGYDYVELDVTYKMDLYPFFPPFVKLLRPRFHGFMMGAVASSDLFKLSHWDPVRQASQTLTLLRNALQKDGAIDVGSDANSLVKFPDGAYTPMEHALLRLQLLSEVGARASTLLDTSVGANTKSKSATTTAATTTTATTSTKSSKSTKQSAAAAAASAQSGDELGGAGSEDDGDGGAGEGSAWAKGTGYGFSGLHSWDIDNYLRAQREKDNETLVVLEELDGAISKADATYKDEDLQQGLYATVEGSCLVPFLEQYLSNESLLDMARHMALYEALFSVVRALTKCAYLRGVLARLVGQSPSRVVMHLLEQRAKQCRTLLKSVDGAGVQAVDDTKLARIVVAAWELVLPHKEQLDAMSRETEALEQRLAGDKEPTHAHTGDGAVERQYTEALASLQFDEHDMSGGGGSKASYQGFHFADMIAQEKQIAREKTLRAAQEQSSLSTSLPLSLSSSVFVRVDSSRIDTLRALISGPDDTPYQNGCFLFDIFLPSSYPHRAPLVNLETTGNGSVRFNPNLYNCGKVCLSLLGTWAGDQGETWNRDTSTLLQVFVSIQSLILVPQPYFNEPSFERSMHTSQGKMASASYNQDIRFQTLRWAVLGQLETPPAGFEEIVRTHFRIKRDLVRKQCADWTEEADRAHKPRMQELVKKIEAKLAQL
jgi:baculoviral IAP repeat-containing protein 6